MAGYVKIQIRRDSTENWQRYNPVLLLGEIGCDTTLHRLKVGDGVSAWDTLSWIGTEVINDLVTGGTGKPLSAEQGKVLKGLIDSKTSVTVIDNLTSTSRTEALSANQGRVLKELTDSKPSRTEVTAQIEASKVIVEDNLVSTSRVNALSANQGRILKGLVDSKADSSDVTTQINNLEERIQVIEENPVAGVTVEDTLTSTSRVNALSANQGRVLKGLVDSKADSANVTTQINNLEERIQVIEENPVAGVTVEDTLTSTSRVNALSANQGRVLKGLVDSKADSSDVTNIANRVQNIEINPVIMNSLSSEEWEFKLKSGGTVTKKVALMS